MSDIVAEGFGGKRRVHGKQHRDRRIQKTQDLLRSALADLFHDKPYDSISVKEILDRANVGRSTFYMHFRDKDDLLISGIHDMLGSIRSTGLPSSATWCERAIWFSLPVFEHVNQHRHTSAARMGAKGRAIVHEHLRKALAELISDDVRKTFRSRRKVTGQLSPDLLVQYLASTFILVLNWWVESQSKLSAKEANDSFRSLVLPTLNAMGG